MGLADYGRPGNYVARQLARWSRQCEAATLPLPGAMRQLRDWLPQHVPATDETTLVHGDYRLDNLFRMAAILHGIAQRAADGTAAVPDAVENGRRAAPLAELDWQCALCHQARIR